MHHYSLVLGGREVDLDLSKFQMICLLTFTSSQSNLTECRTHQSQRLKGARHWFYSDHIVNIWSQETLLPSLVKTSRTESERESRKTIGVQ